MKIEFEGIKKADPESITTALRRAFESIETQAATAAPLASTPPGDFPDYKDVRAVTLRYQAGTYGGGEDPRVSFAASYAGSGLSSDRRRQRFRFDRGTTLFPFLIAPVDKHNWTHSDVTDAYTFDATAPVFRQVAFGCLVSGIAHDLGRIPERLSARFSAGPEGPTGQRVEVTGGAFLGGAGVALRADVDFLPIFGIRRVDVERRLRMLMGFAGSAGTASDHSLTDNVGMLGLSTNFSSPDLLQSYASEMITTDRLFSGLLIATVWGCPSWQQTVGFSNGANTTGFERMLGMLGDPVTGALDPMGGGFLPEVGKCIWTGAIQSTNTLQQHFAAGVKVALSDGTVDFVLE